VDLRYFTKSYKLHSSYVFDPAGFYTFLLVGKKLVRMGFSVVTSSLTFDSFDEALERASP
jgi:hypothetical protein